MSIPVEMFLVRSETCFLCIRILLILLRIHLHYEKEFSHSVIVLSEFILTEEDELFFFFAILNVISFAVEPCMSPVGLLA